MMQRHYRTTAAILAMASSAADEDPDRELITAINLMRTVSLAVRAREHHTDLDMEAVAETADFAVDLVTVGLAKRVAQ